MRKQKVNLNDWNNNRRFIIYSFTVIYDDGIRSEIKYNIKFKSTKIIKFFVFCFVLNKVASFIILWVLVILIFNLREVLAKKTGNNKCKYETTSQLNKYQIDVFNYF